MPASKILPFSIVASTALVSTLAIAAAAMALTRIFGDGVGYAVLIAFIALAIVAWHRTTTDQAS
ncbi:hypothetical protein [Burkholderia sp. BCC1977]|uniref:hypothetical protein n=1 Tax=Burkholderia sp. BCC1977 TaxID=2817440 RepID=UPI002ABD5E52|nr:hypothetical protein [Burkholderia sp. BCC1977]